MNKLKTFTPADLKMLQGMPFDMTGFQGLRGREEGYNERGDVITETTDGFPLNRMWDEFQKVIRVWNAQRDALTNLLTFNVTALVEGVRYPTEGNFQEATEFGVPTGIRLGPSFRMGYDFRWWDLAVRYTWMFLAEATQEQVSALNNEALEADNRLLFTKIMARVFSNVTNVADIDGESVNVYGFYNGDTQVPPKWKTTTFTSGHDHFLTSGATVVDSGDLDDMIVHMTHHGYTAQRGYRLVVMVNEQEADTIQDFSRANGDKFDFIPNPNYTGGGIILPANGGIIGAPAIANLPGLITIGTYGTASIVMEEYIPAGYMLGFATGGENNLGNPVGIRQHEKASLRGLKLVKGADNDYPLIDSYYLHGFGTGVRHRGAGVVMQIATDPTYDIPTDYVY